MIRNLSRGRENIHASIRSGAGRAYATAQTRPVPTWDAYRSAGECPAPAPGGE